MLRLVTGLLVVLRSAIRRRRVEEELEEEFQYHLEEEINERMKAGLAPEEARYAAMRAMGAISKSKEECRDARGTRWLENIFHDFRHGLRSIKRSKGLALGVVISMGLGIGATASVFTFVEAALFRVLPVPETNRVVRINNSTPTTSFGDFSYPEYEDYVERSRSFSGIVSYQNVTEGLAVKPGDEPRVILATLVSGNFFSTLQVKPVLGRGFLPEEDSVPGRDAVAVISYREWLRDFGGAADVVGRIVAINGHPFTIVGVAPEEFGGVDPYIEPHIYIPRMTVQLAHMGLDTSSLTNRSVRFAGLLARLKPEVTIEHANEDIGRIASQLEMEHPETNKGRRAVAWTQFGYRQAKGRNYAPGVLLLGVAFLVLGIACVNVSNLLLSTALARTGEMAVRAAMGAPRTRLLCQLLIESTILSGVGTIVGLAIASWCARFLDSIQLGPDVPVHLQTRVNVHVVLFTLAVGLLSALMSGAIPAWRCSRSDLNCLLKSSEPRNRPHKVRVRQMLAGAQVAVTVLLLVISALFLKELKLAGAQNPGFRVEHLLTMNLDPTLDPSIGGNDQERIRAFYSELVARVRAMPGVRSAAIAQDKPFGVVNNGSTNLIIEGYQLPPNQRSIETRSAFVGDGYFEALDIPVMRGRAFDRRDGVNGSRTVIVNETMAQRFWPNRDPIGSHVEIKEDGGGSAEVIGIARNSKYAGMDERSMPFLYRSYDQGNETGAALLVETDGGPESFVSAVRTEIRNIAPNVGVFGVRSMKDHFNEVGLLEVRLSAEVFTTVGAVGLVLGVLGLYGVIAYSVGQRTHEIGIRMAVGASDRQVLRMVLLQGLGSSGIAAAIGICLALALSGAIAGFVSYVNPRDPVIYIGVLLLMLFVTGAACYIPARRASMVDPNVTLRN
jgi:predicted permease